MAFTLVQKASQATGGVVAFSSANTAGNLLICAVRGGSACSVADPSNGAWTKAEFISAGSNGIQIWHVLSCVGAGPITVTCTSGQEPVISEWSPRGTRFSGLVNGAASSSTSLSSGAIVTTSAGGLIIAASSNEGINGSGLTWGGGFVDIGTNANGNVYVGTQQGGAGSYTATATVGGSAVPNAIAITAYYPALVSSGGAANSDTRITFPSMNGLVGL